MTYREIRYFVIGGLMGFAVGIFTCIGAVVVYHLAMTAWHYLAQFL